MNAKFERRSYSIEFKIEAVRLANRGDRQKSKVAEELGISRALLYNWCRQYGDLGESAFQKESGLTAEQQEIKRLRLEVKQLKEDREILKKAAAFFAREPK